MFTDASVKLWKVNEKQEQIKNKNENYVKMIAYKILDNLFFEKVFLSRTHFPPCHTTQKPVAIF